MKTQTLEEQIREILQRNIAGEVSYESKQAERILLEGLRNSEKELINLLQQAGEVAVKEYKKKVKDIIPWKMIWNIENGFDFREKIKGWNECVDCIQTKFNLLKEKI